MENKGKRGFVALVDGEGFCRPTRQRKNRQAYVDGVGEDEKEPLFLAKPIGKVFSFLKIRYRNYESFGCI